MLPHSALICEVANSVNGSNDVSGNGSCVSGSQSAVLAETAISLPLVVTEMLLEAKAAWAPSQVFDLGLI